MHAARTLYSARSRRLGPFALLLAGALLLFFLVTPVKGQQNGGEGEDAGDGEAYDHPHGPVVDFLFPAMDFGVVDLTEGQRQRMATYTARLHRGYGEDLHHLYHGGSVSGLRRELSHLRFKTLTYRKEIIGVLSDPQRRALAATFDEDSFERTRHGNRVLRAVLGQSAVHDYYGGPDRHRIHRGGARNLGFRDSHGISREDNRHHPGDPPPP